MYKFKEEAYSHISKIHNYYRNIAIDNECYRDFVNAIVDNKVPIYFHCSYGKDRTGVAAITLLLILGVDIHEIKKDYLLTNKRLSSKISQRLKAMPEIKDNPELKQLTLYTEAVAESTFDLIICSILDNYGSFENYLLKEFGLTKRKLAVVRNIYLDKKEEN